MIQLELTPAEAAYLMNELDKRLASSAGERFKSIERGHLEHIKKKLTIKEIEHYKNAAQKKYRSSHPDYKNL